MSSIRSPPTGRGQEDDEDRKERGVYDSNLIPYRIDRQLIGLAGPDYNTIVSCGLPFEPEDCRYGESRISGQFRPVPVVCAGVLACHRHSPWGEWIVMATQRARGGPNDLDSFAQEFVQIEQLHLDARNPRIEELGEDLDEEKILEVLWREYSVDEVAMSQVDPIIRTAVRLK